MVIKMLPIILKIVLQCKSDVDDKGYVDNELDNRFSSPDLK